MRPNELLKKGAALIGWFVNPRGKNYYDPVQTDGDGSLYVSSKDPLMVQPDIVPEVIESRGLSTFQEVTALAVPAYTDWINIDTAECGLLLFLKNTGVNNTTTLYYQVASNRNGTGILTAIISTAFAATPGSVYLYSTFNSSWPAAFGGIGTKLSYPMSVRFGVFDTITNNCRVQFELFQKKHITAR